MSHLVPCPACSRHVLAAERGCPFCGVELPAHLSPPPALPRARLGRAAMFAAGATLVGVAACKNGTSSKDAGVDQNVISDASGMGGNDMGPHGGNSGVGGTAGGGGAIGSGGGAGRGTAGAAGGTAGGGGTAGAPGTGGIPGSGGAVPIDAGGGGTGGPAYGGPPFDAGSRDSSSPIDGSQDRGVIALYGAAPFSDLSAAPKPER
jgi:hypothetical protein